MLKHPKGYRRYVPPGEVLLALINSFTLVLAVFTLIPAIGMSLSAWASGDHPMPTPNWSIVGLGLVVINALAFYWAHWVLLRLRTVVRWPLIWLSSIVMLLSIVLFQWSFLVFWITRHNVLE
jgi:hypothetical protein